MLRGGSLPFKKDLSISEEMSVFAREQFFQQFPKTSHRILRHDILRDLLRPSARRGHHHVLEPT